MITRRATSGFTLLEVLVALTLVASALGGTTMVVREALRTQAYLERRLFAQWVADNALNQFLLGAQSGAEAERSGREVMLGRTYDYVIDVRPLPEAPARDATPRPVSSTAASDGEDVAEDEVSARGPAPSEVAVEVRDADSRRDPLVRRIRRVALEEGA